VPTAVAMLLERRSGSRRLRDIDDDDDDDERTKDCPRSYDVSAGAVRSSM